MAVLLKKPIFAQVTNKEIAQQLESRKKCQKKLPTWYHTDNIFYPPKLHIEQTSSEILAQYKAGIINGKTLLDISGGLGVDSYYFSHKFSSVTHCEIDAVLSQIAAHNFKALGADNIRAYPENGLELLKRLPGKVDWIYIDPSRRNEAKEKIVTLRDSQPNVVEHLGAIFKKTNRIMVKTSPLLDLSTGIDELEHVQEIHIVALKNEVKELLWILNKDFHGEICVKTTNIVNDSLQSFDFEITREKKAASDFGPPLSYLYEPNAAIMKAGAFKLVGKRHGLKKLHTNTHLYTSEKHIEFPGRVFRIVQVIPYSKTNMQKLNIDKANITTRNFPESVHTIRKKYKIKDGGERYLFFCRMNNAKLAVILCSHPYPQKIAKT